MASNLTFGPTDHLEQRDVGAVRANPILSVIAFLLALLLGFSAVDMQHQKDATTGFASGGSDESSRHDGRGKWAGYL